jgi:hypothetical protein
MVPVELKTWALRHHVSLEALAELSAMLGAGTLPASSSDGSEGRVQSQVRLAAPAHGMRLFRNNVGVLTDERGVPVRYGLANDSKALNARLKSADLIGWRRFQIQPQHVGSCIAQFVSLECKHEGWTYRGDAREEAQARWAGLVAADGGFARFVTGPQDIGQ